MANGLGSECAGRFAVVLAVELRDLPQFLFLGLWGFQRTELSLYQGVIEVLGFTTVESRSSVFIHPGSGIAKSLGDIEHTFLYCLADRCDFLIGPDRYPQIRKLALA